jgi:hypothetical protein
MNCGEAVKASQYAVEAPRKQVPKKIRAQIPKDLVYPRRSVKIRGKNL